MKLSDISQYGQQKVTIVKDCEFEKLYLLGKPTYDEADRVSFLMDVSFVKAFLDSGLAGVICTPEVAERLEGSYTGGICVAENPKTAFFQFHNGLTEMRRKGEKNRIAESAVIHETATIAEENVRIGANVQIGANVIIKENTVIDENTIIWENALIGSPGFCYFGEGEDKTLVKSAGGVKIGKNVELHANTVIEKGVMGNDTVIGMNTKIDHNVFIGHDVHIGCNCIIVGNSSFAGGVTISDHVFIGMAVTAAQNITVGKEAKVSIGSVLTKDVEPGTHVSGNFAVEHDKFIQHLKRI